MLEDFVELQKKGMPLPDIVGELADRYQYDINAAVQQGKTPPQILEDLIKAKPIASGVTAMPMALVRGAARGLYATIPEMVGKGLQATAIPPLQTVGKAIRGVGEAAAKRLEYSTPRMTTAPSIAFQAGEMMAPSFFGGALGGMAGRAIGAARGLRGAALTQAAMKGAGLGGGTLFGASQAREAYERGLKAGLPPSKAVLNGIIQGTIEFGGEYFGTKYLAKLFGLGENEVKGITKKIAEKLGIKSDVLKLGMEALGVEAGTEVGQQFTEELTGALLGASKKNLGEITADALSVIPPTVLMTVLTGAGGYAGKARPEAEAQGIPEPPPQGPRRVLDTETPVSLVPTSQPIQQPPVEGPIIDVTPIDIEEVRQPPQPLLPAPPETAESVIDKAKKIDRYFNVHTKMTKTRRNLILSLLKNVPEMKENAEEHVDNIISMVQQNAALADSLLDTAEGLSVDQLAEAAPEIVRLSAYMSNRQLERAKKILSALPEEPKEVKEWRKRADELRRKAIRRYNVKDFAGFSEMALLANEIDDAVRQYESPINQLPKKSTAFQQTIKDYFGGGQAQVSYYTPSPEVEKVVEQEGIPEFEQTEHALEFGQQATPDQLKAIAERLLDKYKTVNKLGKITSPEDFNARQELLISAQKDREALEAAGYTINQQAKSLSTLFKGENKPEWAAPKRKPRKLPKKKARQMADEIFPEVYVSEEEVKAAGGDYLLATVKKAQAQGKEIPKHILDYYKNRGIVLTQQKGITQLAKELPKGEKPEEPKKVVTPTHGLSVKGSKTPKLVRVDKETKQYVHWTDEYGKKGKTLKKKIASLTPIEKVKIEPAKLTEEEKRRLAEGFEVKEEIKPPKAKTPLTTTNTALDSIKYFLVNKGDRRGVDAFREAMRLVREKFKMDKYSDKEMLEDLKEVQDRLQFKSVPTRSKNPLHTRLIGAIQHVDKMLADKEFFKKVQLVHAVINTFNVKYSPEVREAAFTEPTYTYMEFPTADKIMSELKSYRTYLDSFFTDFISAVSSVGIRGHGVTQAGMMIKDVVVKKEGDFITALYSYSKGDEDPRFVIMQRRGSRPFIVPYSALKGQWKLSEADKQARDKSIMGGYGEIPADHEPLFNHYKGLAITKNIQKILRDEFNLSPTFSQFFTGKAYEAAKKAGIKHESTIKEVVTATPIEPLKPGRTTEEIKKEKTGEVLEDLLGTQAASQQTTSVKRRPKKQAKAKAKAEPKKKGKAKPTTEDINRVLRELLTKEFAYEELSDTAKIPEAGPRFTRHFQDYLTKRIQGYIEHILGNKIKVFVGDVTELANIMRRYNIPKERLLDILNISEKKKEYYRMMPLELLLEERLKGFTAITPNAYSLIFIKLGQTPASDVLHTAFHEIMEALRGARYLTKNDIEILNKEFAKFDQPTEAMADAFGDYMLDVEGMSFKLPGPVTRVFEKIKLFLARLRNYLSGLGFKTAKDIFKAASEGRYREEVSYETMVQEAAPSWLAIHAKEVDGLSFDQKVKESVGENLDAIWKGIKDTFHNPNLGKIAKWVVPPQWHSHPIIQSIFGIVEKSSEKSWEDISDLLEPILPVLKTLSKNDPERYKLLQNAIIASDKADVNFSDESLREDFGLDDELISHYRAVKEVFDNVLDKFFDANERSLVNIISRRHEPGMLEDIEGEPTGLSDILTSIREGFLDKSLYYELYNQRNARIEEYKSEHDGKISNRARGKILDAVIKDYVDSLNITDEAMAAKMRDYISELVRTLMPMERQRFQYKQGFYFPRIRPAGDFAVKVMMADQVEDPDTGAVTTQWVEVDRFHTKPGALTKQNVEKHKIITRERKKYGERAVIIEDPKKFAEIKDTLLPSQVVIMVEPIIRTPNTFFEGVNNRSILNYLSYITTKLQEDSQNPDAYKDMVKILHREIDEDLKARSFARSRWIKRQSGQIDIEALLSGAEDAGRVVGGYETELYPVIRSYVIAEMRNIARNDAVDSINVLINREDIKKQILGDKELYDWYKRYVDGVLSPDTPLMRYSRAAKSMISLWYLGGRVSSAAVQLTQAFVTGGPELAIFENASKDDLLGYRGEALPLSEISKHLKRQTASATRISKAMSDVFGKKLNEEEKQALQKGIKSKVLQSQFINSLMEADDKILGKTFTSVVNLGMKFFQYAEQKSREVGYIAAFRLAREKGLSYDEALDFATTFTNTAFHIYSSTNKPLFATGKSGIAVLSSVPLALKGYQINYLGWIYKAFKNEYGKPYADKVIFSAVYMSLLGGLWAIPLWGDIIDLLSSYLGIPLKKKIQKKITTNVTATKAIEFGLPAAFLGIDFSGSARLDLFPREWSLTGVIDNLLGVWTSAGQKLTRGKIALESDQYVRAVESMAPVAIENMIKAIRYGIGKEEVKTIYGKTVLDQYGMPVKPTTKEAGLMLLGFRPVSLSEVGSVYQATRTIERYWKAKHDRIFIKLKTAKDWQALSKIISEDVNNYNEGVAKYGGAIPFITPQGILRALKNAKGKPSRLVAYL